MKKIIAIFLSIVLIASCLYLNSFAGYIDTEIPASRGYMLLANYTSENANRAGLIHINEYNQELFIERQDISYFDFQSGLELEFYYSSYDNGFLNSAYGENWKTNYDMRLSYNDELDYYTVLYDDGSSVKYLATNQIENGYKYYEEELSILGGLNKLYQKIGSNDLQDVVFEDIVYGDYLFDSQGRMISRDLNGYKYEVKHNDFGIESISDNFGKSIMFEYDNSKLKSVSAYDSNDNIVLIESETASVPYKINFEYSGNKLEKVIYPDGYIVEYDYTFNGKLNVINSGDEKEYIIGYNFNEVSSIKQKTTEGFFKVSKTIATFSKSGDTNIKKTAFKESEVEYDEFGLVNYDEIMMEKAIAEIKEAEKASELATQERVSPCNCDNCEVISCSCECENEDECDCKICKITQKDIIFGDYANYNSSELNLEYNYIGYLKEVEVDSAKYTFNYDLSQNLTQVSFKMSELTDEVIRNEYEYDGSNLISVSNENTNYDIFYDKWGNQQGFEIGNNEHIKYEYIDGYTNLIETETFANNQILEYTYLDNGKVSEIKLNDELIFSYEYIPDVGIKITNYKNNTIATYGAEFYEVTDFDGEKLFYVKSELAREYTFNINEDTYSVIWEYLNDSLQVVTTAENTEAVVDIINTQDKDISIITSGENVLYQIDAVLIDENENIQNKLFESTYNDNYFNKWENIYLDGKVSNVYLNSDLNNTYSYDSLGQLVESVNNATGYTENFSYDNSGNILQRTISIQGNLKLPIINTYEYSDESWGDKLTSFNGKTVTYDNFGNPISYDDNSYTWTSGRMLESISNSENYIEYTYDEYGMRQSKIIYDNDKTTPLYEYNYYGSGISMIGFDVYDYQKEILDTVAFIYDIEGAVYGYIVNGEYTYVYERNAFGEIIGVYNNGDKVATYSYSAYGEPIFVNESDEVSLYNILLYKDYTFDRETQMYYLYSRYYVPNWGRFLNADVFFDTGTSVLGTNMFAYCDNDPVNYSDPWGYWSKSDHGDLTRIATNGLGYSDSYINYMIDGNIGIDQDHSAFSLTAEKQSYHFNRQDYINLGADGDTRGIRAAQWLSAAAREIKGSSLEAMYIGGAMHSFQDFSSHGNIGINDPIASHATLNNEADNREYNWRNNTTRGSDLGFFNIGNNNIYIEAISIADQQRWNEALELTAYTIIIYSVMRNN